MVIDNGDENQLNIQSAGMRHSGKPASENAQIVINENAYPSLEEHKSNQITKETENLLKEADVVYVMEKAHKDELVQMFPNHEQKIHLLTSIAGKDEDVPNPYGGEVETYKACFEFLKNIIEPNYSKIREIIS
jgi:protein-tyrosine-phosphatase